MYPLAEPSEMTSGLQKRLIDTLFKSQNLPIKAFDFKEYKNLFAVYENYTNLGDLINDKIVLLTQNTIELKSNITILDIGCGNGSAEQSVFQKINFGERVSFLGIEPNPISCIEAKTTFEYIQEYPSLNDRKFSFEIKLTDLENFNSNQKFDVIYLREVLYYFPEVQNSILKAYNLLNDTGRMIITIAPLEGNPLSFPYYYVGKQLWNRPPWFSEDIEKVLNDCNFLYHKELLQASLNVTECFKDGSDIGKKILDFWIGANTENLSPFQLRLFLDSLDSISIKTEKQEIITSHPVHIFSIKKH